MRSLLLLVLFSLAQAASPPVESLYRSFRNPPPNYTLSPYWLWNGKVTAAETRRQITEMASQGVRSAVIMNWAGLEPAYRSEEHWAQVGVALDAARAAGLTLDFSDEHLWPSGEAWDYASLQREPSRVLQLHPEYRMRRLTARQYDPAAAVTLEAEPEVVVAARLDDSGAIDPESLTLLPAARELKWKAPPGHWTLFVYTLVPAEERGVRVDLMNPAAVRVFLDLVYEEFARRFPQHLGTTIKFFVADHEGSYGAPLPFTPALWKTFEQRHGYDLRRFLPLADRTLPRAAKVRQDYLETVGHLYATSFVGQVTEWCTRHKVQHGHSDIEENLRYQVEWTGNMFSLWRASTVVYIDALVERARMPIEFKEAVSVAHFEGRPFMVENQGLTGHDSYWSLAKARLGTNMCLLWGANRLVPHYFEYDPGHIQYPPSWFLTQPLWRYFHHYADVARRGLFLNAQGRHDARIAIYHPLESATANSDSLFKEKDRPIYLWNNLMDQTQDYYSALQFELSRAGWDYHMLDAHYMAKAEVSGGNLQLAGERFPVLILPPMTHIAAASAGQIRRFAEAGGLVLAVGPQPAELEGIKIQRFPIRDHKLFMDHLNYTEYIEVPEPVRADLAPVLEAVSARQAPDVAVVSGSRDRLYFSRRFTADAEWFWAVNDTPSARAVTVRFPSPGVFEKWDAESGERFALASKDSTVTLEFGPWDAFFVVRHKGPAAAPALPGGVRRVLAELPNTGWQFTPEAPVRVPYANIAGAAEPVWLAPERLANRNWWLNGPYPYNDHQGFFDAYPPEKGFDKNDPAWKWFESPTLAVRPPVRGGVYYAYVNVWSPTARPAQAALAVFDSVKFWWNGKLILTKHDHPPFVNLRDPWSVRPSIDIRQGWNTVLMKIGPAHAGATGFLFRITDAGGNTLRDLVYAREPVLPEPTTPRRVRLTVDAPPGTAGPSVDKEMDETAIPERAIAFAPRTAPFMLASWTDSTLANYSGSALYDTTFTLSEVPKGERLLLDLGQVGLAAEVWINNQKAGERAWRPYELDITRFARAGVNHLRVRVANSNAGWMAQGPPIYERGAWGIKFQSERERLRTLHPNGLEGPVRILAAGRAE
ncbi:MAG: glycosyl hydrolase [Acidobacteria bacterium]|nr:glycosyl hydrolase [Acidobacteriota bacterium]